MSNFSTRSFCEPNRDPTYKGGQKERYSKHTRKSLRKMALTRDRIGPACAPFCSWVNLKFLVICSTTNSSLYCDKLASIWRSETTTRRRIITSKLRQSRSWTTRQSRGGCFYRFLPSDQEDVLPSRPCTMSRLSRYDNQDPNDHLEHLNLDCRMNEDYFFRRRRTYLHKCFWKQIRLSIADSPTEARIREGMG